MLSPPNVKKKGEPTKDTIASLIRSPLFMLGSVPGGITQGHYRQANFKRTLF